MYSDILNGIHTKDEADQLLQEIDALISNLYKTNLKFKVRASTAKALLHLRGETDKHLEGESLSDLKQKILNLKLINLKVAMEPSFEGIKRMHAWISENLGKGVILDLEIDKNIIGGAVITFEGKYIDLSLRKKIEEAFHCHPELVSGSKIIKL